MYSVPLQFIHNEPRRLPAINSKDRMPVNYGVKRPWNEQCQRPHDKALENSGAEAIWTGWKRSPLPFLRLKKATPTISLNSANAKANASPTKPVSNTITKHHDRDNNTGAQLPLPASECAPVASSAPIPFPSPRPAVPSRADELDGSVNSLPSPPDVFQSAGRSFCRSSVQPGDWYTQLYQRRSSSSCLSQTYFNESNSALLEFDEPPFDDFSIAPGLNAHPTPQPRAAEDRRMKRLKADLKFLEAMRRTVEDRISSRTGSDNNGLMHNNDEKNGHGEEILFDQDVHLLTRLRLRLLEHPLKTQPESIDSESLPSLGAEESDQVDLAMLTDLSSTPTSSSLLSSPPILRTPEYRRRTSTLTPPQLVASLTLRYRDRCSVRKRKTGRTPGSGSPLKNCLISCFGADGEMQSADQ